MPKTFLIAPVRGVPADTHHSIVASLSAQGYDVYWPARDTNQNDDTGYDICMQNFTAIKEADVVHVMWDGKSEGCLFDLGMTFALKKEIKIIALPTRTEGKSFQNMIWRWRDVLNG